MMTGSTEDQAVVLIAEEGLFVPPLRTERQPAPRTGRETMTACRQFDDTARKPVVERRNQTRQQAAAQIARREIAQEIADPAGEQRRLVERREGIQLIFQRQLPAAWQHAFQRPGHVST